ncbi:uncharacterized protein C8R40DRAFT_1174050 [Lentinula edodes]|uniref:uncharacterized protein n=1 Tax=Lentinula edodes TaxID=5353 RepID=UPI001E8ED3B9|nr:uncharacterized protein C8R40DRAFT_1174050 [Lentinula edodes]KAH7871978.1 hypothetical protein C8R40DRAFT_1174050 [Lentinula edodes]
MRSLILGVDQGNSTLVQRLYPDIAIRRWTEAQMIACNKSLRSLHNVACVGDRVSSLLVKSIERCLPKPHGYRSSDYASGPHIRSLLVYQRQEVSGQSLLVDCNELLVSFRLFSEETSVVTDVAYLIGSLADGLAQDQERLDVSTISYHTAGDSCVGYVVFCSVSDAWFNRAKTTPMFEPYGSNETYVATWPLLEQRLSTEELIARTINEARYAYS